MADRHQSQASDLIDRIADWGNTVSEKRSSKKLKYRALRVLAWCLVFLGSILFLPALAALILPYEATNLVAELAVIAAIAALGLALKLQAGRLPRNAIQIDYRASELRLGSERADGVFVRQRVASFRDIGEVHVGEDGSLQLQLRGEYITLRFHDAAAESLEKLATQIAEARESALRAPIRSRVRSRIKGLEASVREVKSRVTSRFA